MLGSVEFPRLRLVNTRPLHLRAVMSELTLDELNVYGLERPFKSAEYRSKGASGGGPGGRRNKMLKQILNNEREAYLQKRGLADTSPKKKDEPVKRRNTGRKRTASTQDEMEEGAVEEAVDLEPAASTPDTTTAAQEAPAPASSNAPTRDVPTCAFLCRLLTQTQAYKRLPASCLPKSTATSRDLWCVLERTMQLIPQGHYTDPKTRLRYHSVEIYEIIKGFVRHAVQRTDTGTWRG